MQIVEWFDIAIVGIVLILGIKGLINGLIREVFGLIGLIGGLVVSSRFSNLAGDFIDKNIYKINNPSMLEFISFICLWICFWILCILIGKFLAKLVGASGLGFIDRFGGFLAGSGKIFLTLAAVLAVISNTNLNSTIAPFFKNSKVYPVLLQSGKWIINMDVQAIKNDVANIVNRPAKDVKIDNLINLSTEEITKDNNISNEKLLIEMGDINTTQGEQK
ncbi:putative membrane protein, CvpA family [Campylobacter pinnipediorum subsp. caledonicus]|uniref:Putative membrane protein, CvpA family n=1 Tax=Campylobacter pinnipediorum subsp. caledonicus TaxID=1874362 RepID=A0A1S6U9R9_9BACT|nr:CvpA family protein [Campylobacter pinnipediorum]AQW86770.1 putative membrane protein, CvpA family [Campylobacter pinnipediorum subsp. caledonicus]AQW88425.1 putative membrane protein, CvpA family [Campylobacter pinnipediorum subsp. caledonicus]OPA72609.1 colicin V synthesis protein [Campylobacter pinnipediorum subsp. caledonicus]